MSSASDQYRNQVSANILSTWKNLEYFNTYSDSLQDISEIGLNFLAGGKRTRALLSYYGALASSDTGTEEFNADTLVALIHLGTALEYYQASALIHDDIIDNAESRRSLRAAHLQFQDLHQQRNWQNSGVHHGVSSAILLGDLWFSLAQKEIVKAASHSPANALELVDTFNLMTEEVAIGQYLDIRLECINESNFKSLSETVMLHKSARYSVAYPLLLGAKLVKANIDLQTALFRAGEHWGIAFQMRDDELGIFGNPELTGKPVGGDLAEGKKTLLYALLQDNLDEGLKDRLEQEFGNHNPQSPLLRKLCKELKQNPVLKDYRQIINQHLEQAERILKGTAIAADKQSLLMEFAQYLASRKS